MRFEDFVLQLDASSRGGFRARVVKSPFGEGAVAFSLPETAGAPLSVPGAAGASRDLGHQETAAAGTAERPPLAVGSELFRTVFQGQVRTLLDKSRGKLEVSPDLGLRLKIKLDPNDIDTSALADLPWELLCDDETEDFFALSRQTSLVRYLDVPRSSQPIPFTPPLRILAVGASPQGLAPLDLREEARRLEELNASAAGVEVRFLGNATTSAVRQALSGDTWNVLHFMGHGVFDRASGEGMLAFEDAHGGLDLVSGRAFATKIRDLRSLGVVVLNACNTARAGHQEGLSPFRGVSAALVLGGVPAVVAMQRPISDRAAIGFSEAFYRHLARGDSIDEALTEGRQAIHSAGAETFEWATPVLFLRIPEGNVFVAKAPAEPAPAEAAAAAAPRAALAATTAVLPAVTAAVPVPAGQAAQPAQALPAEARGPLPAPVPAAAPASGRHGAMLKIAAGAAGAGLLAGTFYFMHLRPDAAPNQIPVNPKVDATTSLTTQLTAPEPQPVRRQTQKKDARGTTDKSIVAVPNRQPDQLNPPPKLPPTPDNKPDTAPPVKPVEAPAPTVDLSKLSAQAAISQRDEGGLRVTVTFRNGADLPLSAVLDIESAELSDNQGQRYSALACDLPARGANRLLNLAASGSATAHFDFGMPKLGSKQFNLALATDDGHRIRVGGSPLTLGGPP